MSFIKKFFQKLFQKLSKWFSAGTVPAPAAPTEVNQYIHNVLETGDHGPYRKLIVNAETLNAAIAQHRPRIAEHIRPDVEKVMPPQPDETRVVVTNDIGNISFMCIPRSPASLDELVDLMATAKRENRRVKAAGSLHAGSPVCETDGFLVKSEKLTGIKSTSAATLKDASQAKGLYEIPSGTKLQVIVTELEKDGRALMNLGGFKGQGIVGATATGTHGSGLSLPPLASMIRGIHLVSAEFGADGKPIQYRIEPTDGITDPARHAGPARLVQEDTLFYAVATGLGAFGVVYSVTIATVPFYWIRETRELTTWSAAKALLLQGPTGDILRYHNAEVWISPYTSDALITRRESVPAPEASQLAGPNANPFVRLMRELPALREVAAEIQGDGIPDELSAIAGAVLTAFLKDFPLLVPTAVHLALFTQYHSEPKTAKYYDIYDIGIANNFPAISTEISYPLNTYIEATDSAVNFLKRSHQQDFVKELPGFMSLRFTAPTPVSLSMSYSADSNSPGRCYLEVFGLYKFFDSVQGYDELVGPISQDSIENYMGRLHWGQYLTPRFTSAMYQSHDPEFFANITAFRTLAEKYDPGHMMANDFLTRVMGVTA